MKKIFFSATLFFIAVSGFAQQNSMQEKTIELIKMTSGQQFEIMTGPVIKMVPEENQEAFKEELMASMDEIYMEIAQVYMDNFTEEEIDKILAFYDTPVGKKMVATMPELTKKGMEIGQQWGMKLQPMIAKYSN